MFGVILFFHALVAVLLIIIILMQQRSGSGMSAVFGGGGVESIFGGSGAAPFMVRVTSVLAAVFFVTSIVLVLTAGKVARPSARFSKELKKLQEQQAAPQAAPVTPFDKAFPESTKGK